MSILEERLFSMESGVAEDPEEARDLVLAAWSVQGTVATESEAHQLFQDLQLAVKRLVPQRGRPARSTTIVVSVEITRSWPP